MQVGYELLDSGELQKLERFGSAVLARPCAAAIWRKKLPAAEWQKATATFNRDAGNRWRGRERLPKDWPIAVDGVKFQLTSTDFGHVGIFPEQIDQWVCLRDLCQAYIREHKKPPRVLNLFAYSGGCTLFAARAGAEVTHVDASKGMVDWARQNAALNGLEKHPIRWIVEDVTKFLHREHRRGSHYDLIILDPPSYGRGSKGETFKIESDLPDLLALLHSITTPHALGVLLSCHTPELTPLGLNHLLRIEFGPRGGVLKCGEMLLRGKRDVLPVPSGSFCWWLQKETELGSLS